MTYEQQGNSCGAWCATHRVSIPNPAWMANAATFTSKALSVYGRVKFNVADADNGWTPRQKALFSQWCGQGYSDPWRIVSYLRWSGIKAVVCIERAASAAPNLADMKFVLEKVGTRGVNPIKEQTLAGSGPGSYAIGVFMDGPGLHFLLLKQGNPWQVYDPRSEQLNWTALGGAPAFGSQITTTIVSPVAPLQRYIFIGVFIAC